MKASIFIGASVDGFIARPDGGIDWLSAGDGEDDGEDYGFAEYFSTVDALVMGRHTFELVQTFSEWLYGDKPVIVLSSRSLTIPDSMPATVEAMSLPPLDVAERLAERGAEHLYIDGGATIQRFLSAGLIDEMTITRVPILIGSGIPLFGPVSADVNLRHVWTRSYPKGLVQTRYEVKR